MTKRLLFPVPLLGVGTADVEALASYLWRLSTTHRAPIGVVLRAAYEWYGTDNGSGAVPYLARNPGGLAQYVRPNEMTRSVVEMLTEATGQVALRSGTFMSLDHALARCMKTFHGSIRWCPTCLREFQEAGAEPYFKLAWFIRSTTRCAKHGSTLEELCAHCGSRQDGFGMRRACIECSRCRNSLISNQSSAVPPGDWRVDGADLNSLVQLISESPQLEFPREGVKRALNELLDDAWRKDNATELWKVVPRDEFLAITCDVTPITLTKVRRLAFRLGVQVTDLLVGSLKEVAGVLDPSWTTSLPSMIRPKKRLPRHDLERLRKGLDAALRASRGSTPLPLRKVASDLGVTGGCVRHHFPVHANEFLRRFDLWRKRETERKLQAARGAVSDYMAASPRVGEITAKGTLRELRRDTKLPKDLLRREIARALDLRSLGIPILAKETATKDP